MTNTRLTTRQAAMMTFIRKHLRTHGYAPTIREIGDACDISSSSVVLSNLRGLEKKGRILRQENTSRAIGLVDNPMSHPLRQARQAVKEIQQWMARIGETGVFHPGELDEALSAYHNAAEAFFEAYDPL